MGSQGNVLGGTMIIAGTAIGAGMLALPMISAGMWIYWSLLLMVLTWMLMLRASQAILEVNLHYEPGSSFHTLVQDTLGPVWSTINGLAVAFVLYILVYAYVSGGGSTVQQTVMAVTGNDPGIVACHRHDGLLHGGPAAADIGIHQNIQDEGHGKPVDRAPDWTERILNERVEAAARLVMQIHFQNRLARTQHQHPRKDHQQ